jgi:hypothetical protein
MAAEFNSPEFTTLRTCTSHLRTVLKVLDKDLVHFLYQKDFITQDVYVYILNPLTLLTDYQKAEELSRWIINRVKQDPPSYHVLLGMLKQSGKVYEPIVRILEADFAKQASVFSPGT